MESFLYSVQNISLSPRSLLTVGYTGGRNAKPSYESVCGGDGHTEAIQIEYDPEQVSYDSLLDSFLQGHQPMRSKAQYKSAIWYHNDEQRKIAEQRMEETGAAPVVDVDEAKPWYDAEDYHQKYYDKQNCTVM
ncbi:Peptide methionine sulfoxide reductase MsrA [Symbiodinium microadriaticum]|uniref:peptide-methionine (S)-S-oxide reductase n=1 Tax=Symbiodinium microadriaticum TaxID=2951 RepID=A0A1Q9C9F8_SYMMI|nr:Peptide methionine sulfoxide reductase MsrA [Symbiodinium microadriaticum]CAE7209672.1 msrA [Symbiodinium microadriaticum]CAE7950044.1 msrA [Symbiodinium sp. KB8]